MSEKLRSVNTRFWNDGFIEDLSPSEKLLFLYLLTNPQANMLGIYEITIKRISYDTGLNKETVSNGLKRFEEAHKAFLWNNFIILPNWLKNQNLNSNMKTGVLKLFSVLPIELKIKLLGNDYPTIQNDYPSLLNALVNMNMNMNMNMKYEKEYEDEIEKESFKGFKSLFETFRKEYPGTKRGLDVEFENLQKRHKDWRDIIPILSEKLQYQIQAREVKMLANQWAPEWKNLQTWINQRSWEEEINTNSNLQTVPELVPPPIPQQLTMQS